MTQATGPYEASDATPATLSLASKLLQIGGYGNGTSFNFDGVIGRWRAA